MKKIALVVLVSCVLSLAFTDQGNAQGEAPELNFPDSNAPTQAKIDFYENEIRKCKDYVDELSLAINKAQILSAADQEKFPGSILIGYAWSKEISEFQDRTRFICNRIEIYQKQIAGLSPPPSPTPTLSPGPSTERSGKSGESSKTTQDKESHEKQVKLVREYRQELREIKTSANKTIKEMDDFAKKNKITTNVRVENNTLGGLSTTTFKTPEGQIIVNLPAGVQAGETISGTSLIAPNGSSKEQCANNLKALRTYGLFISNQRAITYDAGSAPLTTAYQLENWSSQGDVRWCVVNGAYYLRVVTPSPKRPLEDPAQTKESKEASVKVGLKDANGIEVASASIDSPSTRANPDTAKVFELPAVGQTGRNAQANGPFDGDVRNTQITIGGQPVPVLAESPRNCFFKSPENNLGPTEITIKENGVETKGHYRNLGVRLSAPKTNLLRGEQTTVTITVDGLKGIQQNIPLLVEKKGDVSMEGGDVQTVQIRPNDVVTEGADARFDVRKVIVGLRPGVFNITATVIDPRPRPIIIPLHENSGVNGFRVDKDGAGFVINVENVKHPITGDPVDGELKLEHKCPALKKIPYIQSLFLSKGVGRGKSECLILITPRIIIQDEQE